MAPWHEKLEIKILLLAILLPLLGTFTISVGVFHLLRSSLVDVTREWSSSTADILTRSIEGVMVNAGADVTEKMVDDLRQSTGIEEIDVVNSRGEKAFSGDTEPVEADAVNKLRETGMPFSVQYPGGLVFYRPLLNSDACLECHEGDHELLGAVKVTVPMERVFKKGSSLILSAFVLSLLGVVGMGFLLWYAIRRLVVLPVKKIQRAAGAFAEGDLTVDVPVRSRDEIGRLWQSFRGSLRSLSAVVRRINDVSRRVGEASDMIEKDSAEVVRATAIESESFGDIAVSMEQLKASITEISGSLTDLSGAAESAHSASKEMATSVSDVAQSTGELSQAVEETFSTTGEMTHTIRELSWGAQHLSGVSKETLAAVLSVESYLKEVEGNARESEVSSVKVREEAEELGLKSVRRVVESMEQIREYVKQSSDFIESLGGRSKEIGKIVDVIDEINDQTNLLSLNAAILAAQAGEHGKGFQVVAGEIRKLANRTANSTVEISELIGSVQAEVAGAVRMMKEGQNKVAGGFEHAKKSGQALEKVVESSRHSEKEAASIRVATEKQSRNLVTVKETMERLDQMTQFLAQGTAEQKREADCLLRLAEQVLESSKHIKTATAEQMVAGRHIEQAIEKVSSGTGQMSLALADEREGSRHITESLSQVVDLPGKTRILAMKINRGLRGILSDTDLLKAEVENFKVLRDDDRDLLRLGVIPLESPAEMHRRFSPLAAYFSRLLGRTVELKVALDFAGAVTDLGEGRTQIAYLTPSTYVMARESFGAVLLAKALRDGKPFQHSVLISRARDGMKSVKDIRGRSFAFGDPNSTSSHIVPRAMLQEEGISIDDLLTYQHLGHHDDVAEAVIKGEYDAGAVMESVAVKYKEQGIVVLMTSPPIPEFNFCASPRLAEEEREALRRGLLSLERNTPEGEAILTTMYSDYSGFMEAKDEDYEDIRRMMKGLGMLESNGNGDGLPVSAGRETVSSRKGGVS